MHILVRRYAAYQLNGNSFRTSEIHTCDDKLIISLRNQGTQVHDNIDKTAKKAINITNLADRWIRTLFNRHEINACKGWNYNPFHSWGNKWIEVGGRKEIKGKMNSCNSRNVYMYLCHSMHLILTRPNIENS